MSAGSNWNNRLNAGLSYLNSNNVASNSNHNIGTHSELRRSSSHERLNSLSRPLQIAVWRNTERGKAGLVSTEKVLLSTTQLKE